MAKFLPTLFKALLYLLILSLLAGGCFLLTLWQNWPLWLGGAMFAGILALVVLVFFVRKLYFRRREKHFVRQVVDQDDASIQAAPSSDQKSLQDMQQSWARAVKMLQNSKLRLQGNPLYVLPWYMVLGESGSGKTTAIRRSGLTSIITDVSPEAGQGVQAESLNSTRNVDWCFFKEAIILDTAGRYAIPVDEGPDKREWENFLALLTRYRRKEPLDGLVVTVSAQRLFEGNEEQLREYGLSLRTRIDQMMRSMGARFPVYVLVTKLDLLFGLDSWQEILGGEGTGQSMGYAVHSSDPEPKQVAYSALEHVANRLRELHVPLLSRLKAPHTAAITFPAELNALKPALSSFMQGCFAPSPYTETPFLRGIYFSSGRQQGQVRTSLMQQTELFQENPQLSIAQSEKGLFLTDLFANILPGDRGIFTPLREFLQWRTVTRNLVLISWLLLTFCLAGLFSYAYVNTREAIEIAAEPFPEPPKLNGHLGHDLYMLSIYANAIELMQEEAAKSKIGHMGLGYAQQAAQKLQKKYVRLSRNKLLYPLDKQLNSIFTKMNSKELNRHISEYISYVAWRVDMIEHYLTGQDSAFLPVPPDQALALALGGQIPEIAPLFRQVYEDYLKWSKNDNLLRAEARELRMWLDKIIAQEGVELHWLLEWADTRPKVQPVTLGEFWSGPNVQGEQEVRVKGAFTPDGYQTIDKFLGQVRSAVQDPRDFAYREKNFRKWYTAQYYQAWEKFASKFSQGRQRLLSPGDWQNQASIMATLQNPYFQLLERIDKAFDPVSDNLQPPALGSLAGEFLQLRSTLLSKSDTATLAEEIKEKLQRKLKKLEGQFEPQAMQDLQARVKATKALQKYIKSLHKFLPPTVSLEGGYKFASRLYSGQGDKGSSSDPLQEAEGQIHTIKANLSNNKRLSAQKTQVFWQVVRGPLVYMVDYISNEASCQVQIIWEDKVLSRIQDIPELKLREKLMGKKGLVYKFASGPAAPFVQRTRKGWAAKRLLGVSFPVNTSFLQFLDQASKNQNMVQDKYTIHISGLPTDVNQGAQVDPLSTKLSLDCEDGVRTLTNFNYPISKDFVWKPEKCSDVTLAINFPNLKLIRTWKGRDAMQKFLRKFADNKEHYGPGDFGKNKDMLKSLNINKITVAYKMQGAEQVRDLLDQKPPDPPEDICWCWYRQ